MPFADSCARVNGGKRSRRRSAFFNVIRGGFFTMPAGKSLASPVDANPSASMRSADLTAGRGPCDVTVTICTYNRQRLLEGALESILANQVPVGVSYEVIVVDNN